MAVDRVTWQWLFGMPTPALCRGRLPSHWRPPLPGGGSRTATYPVADSHQARVNDGRTEERGTGIQRINRDLTRRSFFWIYVWIRLFRPVRAIAEPWDEGDRIEWAKMAVDRVTWQWLFGMPAPALCRGRLPSHWRPPLPGGGSRAATYPVADSHQARVNDGRTEERGTVI